MDPTDILYQSANGQLAPGFAALLSPITLRVPVEDFRKWCRALPELKPHFATRKKDDRDKFYSALSAALRRWTPEKGKDLYGRIVGLITVLVAAEATQSAVDNDTLQHFARVAPDDHLHAVADLLHGLYDLFSQEASPPTSEPVAFYYIATAARNVAGLREYPKLRPPIQFYLGLLEEEEKAVAVLTDIPSVQQELTTDPAELRKAYDRLGSTISDLDRGLGRLKDRLNLWAARRRKVNETAAKIRETAGTLPEEVTRIDGTAGGFKSQVDSLAAEVKSLQVLLGSLVQDLLDSPRLIPNVRYLRTRMSETLESLRGKRQLVLDRLRAVDPAGLRQLAAEPPADPPPPPPVDPWGWWRWYFSGTPVTMTSRGWLSVGLLATGILLFAVGLVYLIVGLARPPAA